MSTLGYTRVTPDNPFLKIFLLNENLTDILSAGNTNLVVTRVGQTVAVASYPATEVDTLGNTLTFALDNTFLAGLGGRYSGVITYNGTVLGTLVFEYVKPAPTVVGG